ncbi:MAG: prenyltransferase/squalene oxidase repeat-containing protein [Candidatus Hermodarchaeota archaeon]
MRHRRLVLGIIIIAIAWTSPLVLSSGYSPLLQDAAHLDVNPAHIVSADDGVIIDWSPVIVLELPGHSIPARGSTWVQVLQSAGVAASVVTVSDLLVEPTIIHAAPLILVDGSLGADDASHVPAALVDLLIGEDVSIVLTGRAAWLLHLLRGRGPPSGIALSNYQLSTTPGLEGAIYLSSPVPLSLGSSLTTESSILLPDDPIQTENSRLVDLTGSGPSSLASLRYDSWPLEAFLFAPENPLLLTTEGRGLVVNTLAYAIALRENAVSQTLAAAQSDGTTLLPGGYSYAHEPTMAGTYYAVQMAVALMGASEWALWKSARQGLVLAILNSLAVDFGAETGFLTAKTDGSVGCKSTAQGLWVLSIMGLSPQFTVTEIVAYLASRQGMDGDFENHITTTYHVTEALASAGSLGTIDTVALESWLRSCVIDGGKTSDPDLWGSIGSNPASTSPTNQYASNYVQALDILGTTHNDPVKLTSWIVTRTAIGDGSFRNTVGPGEEITIGTSSALTAMALMGTLSSENRTNGLSWLESNQLDSGGFGLEAKDGDIVAKTKESYCVAVALNEMSETSISASQELKSYLIAIETNIGFELMDPVPSLMWNYWLATISRMNHAAGVVDEKLQAQYLDLFSQWTQYPWWNNFTAVIAPEYGVNQYRTKSVWTQYFGVATASAQGVVPSSEVMADALNYISLSQFVTGHFRPAMFIGTAHIQHSVAAVEALYLMDSLDSIPYRSSLESAMLNDYSSGQWSMSGWTIKPYAGEQSAIDWLCTRAAVRLNIVDTTMAVEISSSINSRIQYNNIYALSCDVATLALLNASGFDVNLESIEASEVLNALGPTPYANGWLNATDQWQPVYTAESLEMVSILGMRPLLIDVPGSSISISTDATVSLGSSLYIDVGVSSSVSSHSVLVYAFDEWTKFTNVENSDTLRIDIPGDTKFLGHAEIYAMVTDWSLSRAFAMSTVEVRGELEGTLTLDTPNVSAGSFINGTVSWIIAPELDAGTSNITVRLGDPPAYQQWSYQDSSPFALQVPSSGFATGTYNLTVTLERKDCGTLILRDAVDISAPVSTYLISPSFTTATADQQINIDWSLHYSSNGTDIASQETTITILDELGQIVYTTQGVSSIGGSVFHWTPSQRGNFSYTISFLGNGPLVGCESSGLIHVYEDTILTWLTKGVYEQYSEVSIEARLETSGGTPLAGYLVHVTVTSPSFSILIDTDMTTNSTGHVSVQVTIDENGLYDFDIVFAATDYLRTSMNSKVITAWSNSTIIVGGISGDNSVGTTWAIWAYLLDSFSNPISGESITLRVILLPSTVVAEYTLDSNTTGYVEDSWVGDSAGSYRLEAEFAGTGSRGSAIDSGGFTLWVPVTLALSIAQPSEVGVETLIEVRAEDHLGSPINGLSVTVSVRDPRGVIQIQESGTTSGGLFQITWTPLFRGQNRISAASGQQSWYDAALASQTEEVYEQPSIDVLVPLGQESPSLVNVIVSLSDYHGLGVSDVSVRTIFTINGQLLLDVTNTTQGDGTIAHMIQVSVPGILSTSVTVVAQGWLLFASAASTDVILGTTDITLTTPGLPIEQGTQIGIVVALTDWSGVPLNGAQVIIEVRMSNGTIIDSAERMTGADGKCTLAHNFHSVGDFLINATYAGEYLNSSATASSLQRVYMTPSMQLSHSPSCMLGETLEIYVSITDAYQQNVVGRTLLLSVEQNSIIVFETEVESVDGLLIVHWDPEDRGLASITLLHAGDPYYYTNSTGSTVSVLELVSANLFLEPSSVNMFNTASLQYVLQTEGTLSGVVIHFEVLGLDLVPVWSADLATNASGIAEAFYYADDSHGVLTIRASPTADQFLIGGDTQEQLNAMTTCTIATTLAPVPARAGEDVNITLNIIDQLGIPVENLDVVVSLDDPLGDPVRLGYWSNSITVTTSNGLAIVSFVPTMTGLYSVHLSCSGATSVHSFTDDTFHTVYSQSSVTVSVSEAFLDVGDMLEISVLLSDYRGSPMVGRDMTIVLNGPGGSTIGPMPVVTDSSGHAYWSVQIDDEGLWSISAIFDGLGVYLPATGSTEVSVRYSTEIHASIISTDDIIAGIVPASILVLLTDSGGSPLEGFTIDYYAYHDQIGLMMTDSVVQTSPEPLVLNITLDRMGNYTLLLSFAGTTHYHASNSALRVWVYGTTNITFSVTPSIERSSNSYLIASVIDEQGSVIDLNELSTSIDLIGPSGIVDLFERLQSSYTEMSISLEGLEVGLYTLSLVVLDNTMRVGCTAQVQFNVTAWTDLLVLDERFSGIIDEDHEISFTLVDSIGDVADGAIVYASLYSPSGREILGSPLTTRTAYPVSADGIVITWSPSFTGNYTLTLMFEGTDFWQATSQVITVLIRYMSHVDVDHPSTMEFGQPIPLSITLSSGVFRISDASLRICVWMDEQLMLELPIFTGTRGGVDAILEGLLAGNLTVEVQFNGTDIYAPTSNRFSLSVTPLLLLEVMPLIPVQIGLNTTLNMSYSILGVDREWTGGLEISIFDPQGMMVATQSLIAHQVGYSAIEFYVALKGEYIVDIVVNGLPVVESMSSALPLLASSATPSLPMDEGTTPWIGGLGIVAAIAVLARRRVSRIVGSLPGEWEG